MTMFTMGPFLTLSSQLMLKIIYFSAQKNPTISHESWTKVKGLLETATANDKASKVVQFKDGSILKELYKVS